MYWLLKENKLKLFKMYLLLVLSLIIQTTFIHKFTVFNVFPNIVLVLVFIFALTIDTFDATVFAFVSGFLLDLLTCKIIGLNAILVTYIAFLISLFGKKLFYSNMKSLFLLTIAFTIVYQGVFYFLSYTIWQNGSMESAFPIIIVEAIYNSIVSVMLYKLVIKKYILSNG